MAKHTVNDMHTDRKNFCFDIKCGLLGALIGVCTISASWLWGERLSGDGAAAYWLEAFGCLLLLVLLLGCKPFRASILPLGGIRLAVLGLVVGLVIWGQIVRNYHQTYPFVHWSMYTNPNPNRTYIKYQVTYQDGTSGLFPFEEVAVHASLHSFSRRIRRSAHREDQIDSDQTADTITTLMDLYNSRNPDQPIVHFQVIRCQIPLRGYTGPGSIEQQLIAERFWHE